MCGVAIEVPLMDAYPVGYVETMPTPGALMSTNALAVENDAWASVLSVAATQITLLNAHGYSTELSLVFPAAAMTVTPAANAASKVGCIAEAKVGSMLPPRL